VAKCQSTTLKLPLCHPTQTMASTHVSLKLPPQLPAAILQQERGGMHKSTNQYHRIV
jgi:hypothetical protein